MPSVSSPQFALWLGQLLCCLFFAILFLQSGLDKVLDWKGNVGWMTPHFAKSPLRGLVPLMLGGLTVLEVGAGVLCGVGLFPVLLSGDTRLALAGAALSGFTLVALFLGQRLAKDYAGAAGLVPYFLVALVALAALAPR
jgi:uncharacterized membrane protein YphA (DoxX/SURF4 family)